MTTNQQRVAQVIYDALSGQYGDFGFPADAAQALADAGLLMPDLPEPDREGDWGPSWDGAVEAEPGHYAVRINIAGQQFRQSSQFARLFALALLAAAETSEKNT